MKALLALLVFILAMPGNVWAQNVGSAEETLRREEYSVAGARLAGGKLRTRGARRL